MGSMSFWCDGPTPLPHQEPTDEQRKGGMIKYPTEICGRYESHTPKAEYHAPDTCIDIIQGNALKFSRPATCRNGTRAMAAGFKGKGCNPTNNPLKDPFTVWDNRYIGICIPTDEIKSMAFWCDGFDGIDMTKARKVKSGDLGLILGLGLGLGGVVVFGGGIVVAYFTNWHFRTWVQVSCCLIFRLERETDWCVGTVWWWGWLYCFVRTYFTHAASFPGQCPFLECYLFKSDM